MNRETISLLNPRRSSLDSIGGEPEVTWEDVTRVLATLPDHISAYARLKYKGDFSSERYGSSFHEAVDALRSIGGLMGMHERMQAGHFIKMTHTAMIYSLSGGRRCPRCKGVQQIASGHSFVVCPTCDGQGKLSFSDAKMAEFIGYSDGKSYSRYGKKHFETLITNIDRWDRIIASACQNRG